MPNEMGMFILGGSDADDNFSKRCTIFKRYHSFDDRSPMLCKRAFFPSIFHIQTAQVFVFGGNGGDKDLSACESFNVVEN
jgi:hypothetical protein